MKDQSNISVLADMAVFGCKTKDDIENEKIEDLINYQKALDKTNDEHVFVLGLIGKYLEEVLDICSRINLKNDFTRLEEQDNAVKSLQHVSNGFITKYKNNISIECIDSNMLKDIKNYKSVAKKVNDSIKERFINRFKEKLNDQNFAFTNYTNTEGFVGIFIPFKDGDVELNEPSLKAIFKGHGAFGCHEPNLEEKLPISDAIILSKAIFLPHYDVKDDSKYGMGEKRGKENYIPPLGWLKWALLVNNIYGEDDTWSGYDEIKSWCVGYIGLGDRDERENKVKEFENDEDLRNNGKNVGLGVWLRQDPKKMEEDCSVIKVGNEEYKVGFWMRVKPEAIRIPKSGNGDYWVVNGITDELRPFAIITKRIK